MNIEKVILSTSKTDSTGCGACAYFKADNLKHALARLNGVSKVKVNEITGKVIIEYGKQKINLSKITERIEKLGYQVEILSRDEIQ
ncbi:cation transporter [Thermoproteota archaeon]